MARVETRLDQCQICLMKCGLAVEVDIDENRVLSIGPDKNNPAWRDFCRLGGLAHRLIDHPQRLQTPMKRVGDRYVPATYEEACDDIAARLRVLRDQFGDDAIGMYVGNPGALSNAISAYAFDFIQGIGSNNRYMVTSIDNNSMYAVNDAMFGGEWYCLMADIDAADCYLYLGTNPAISAMNWLDVNTDGWRRVLDRVKQGADLIVVDPRLTETAKHATTHVAIKPGEDWAFLLGVIKAIFDNGWEHREDCTRANGIDSLRELAQSVALEKLADICDVPAATIENVASRFARARRAHVQSRTGLSQTRNGTLGEWLGQVLNLITGRFDREGGRYVQGGVINLTDLSEQFFPGKAHNNSRVRGLRPFVGSRAVSEMPDEIETPGPGQMRALMIVGGNPVTSGPQGDALDRALQKLDLLVAIDLFQRESHRHAHWLIPGTHFLEREEFTPLILATRDQASLQYKTASVTQPASIRPEWEFFVEVARRLDVPLFGQPAGTVTLPMVFEGSLAGTGIAMSDVKTQLHGLLVESEKFGHFWSSLRTTDKKVEAAPPAFIAALRTLLDETPQRNDTYPFRMISRRRRDMMNSSLVEEIQQRPETLGNVIEINPDDAHALNIAENARVNVTSKAGSLDAIARYSRALRRGVVCMEHGFGSRLFNPATGAAVDIVGTNRNRLIANDDLDPLSAMPRFNDTPVRVQARE